MQPSPRGPLATAAASDPGRTWGGSSFSSGSSGSSQSRVSFLNSSLCARSSSHLPSGYWALVRTGISPGLVESKSLLVFKAVFTLKFALKKQPDRIYPSPSRLLFLSSHAKWFLRRRRNSDRKQRPWYRPVTAFEANQWVWAARR